MKERIDFVSNSSTSSFMIPIDEKTHDQSKWLKNSLRIQPDTNKIMMEFDDFEFGDCWDNKNNVQYNWRFLCTQFIHWVCPELLDDGTPKTAKKLLRQIHNSDEFSRINNAVKEYLNSLNISCDGIEFDEEDIRSLRIGEDSDYSIRQLIPECQLNHESVYGSLDEMMKEAKCKSIAELIWGIKEIGFSH